MAHAPHHTALSVQDFVAARDFFVKGVHLGRRDGLAYRHRAGGCAARRLYPLGDTRSQRLPGRAIQYYTLDGEWHGRRQSDRGSTLSRVK
jgi:hypothetical protein